MSTDARESGFRRAVLALVVLLTLLLTAPIGVAQDAPPLPSATPTPYQPGANLGDLDGEINVDGSSTVWPIIDEAAIRFTDMADDVKMAIDFSGTSGGFAQFCAGETDIQNASRLINDEETATCAGNDVSYYAFEVGYDGITVVVSPENDFVDCLTVDQLKRLWQPDDNVDTWQDLDPAWPDREIELYGPGPDSGTFDYFTEQIVGEARASRTDYFPSESDLALVDGVAEDENALAYFGFAYYEQAQDRLKLVAVDAGGGCITPTPETIADGTYQPLSRPLYVYVKAASLTRPEVQEFMRYLIAAAPEIVGEVGYVRSPGSIYVDNQAKLEAAIGGSLLPDGPTS